MGKGIKNIAKKAIKIIVAAVSAAMVLVVTLPLLATLLVNVPWVQNMLARNVMEMFSENLGTRVSIDRIHVKLINRVVVDGFYVEDFKGDTLLWSKRVTAPIVDLGLAGGALTFGRVTLDDTEMWIRRDSLDGINIREMVHAMRGGREKNPDSKFRLHIQGIDAPNITFGLLRWDKPFKDEGVDFSRFVIRNTKVDIDRLSVIRDTIRIGINSLAFDERSGFRMDRLSAHDLVVGNGRVWLDNVHIEAHGAGIDAPQIHLTGDSWPSYRNFMDSVSLDVRMRNSTLPTAMLGWFVPAVKDFGLTLGGLALTTEGPVAAMVGNIEQAHTLGSSFSLGFHSSGLPDFGNTWIDADVRNISTTAGDVDSLMHGITGKGLPPGLRSMLDRIGEVGFRGTVTGKLDGFRAAGTLVSDAGEISANTSMARNGVGTRFDGQVNIPGFDVGQMLDTESLGEVAAELSMQGRLDPDGHIEGDVEGDIHSLVFNGYRYRSVVLDGRMDDRMFDGMILARDPNMDFDFMGMFDFNGQVPRYNFDLDLRRADLAATNLFARDSVALLSARMVASGSGNDLDNLNGRIEVLDPVYIAPADTLRTELISVVGRNSPDSKQIKLNSDFADAEFRSRISYRDMFAYLADFLRDYIPLLYDDAPAGELPQSEGSIADAANYSILKFRAKDTDKLLGVFVPGSQIADDTEASFTFNPFLRSFSLRGKSSFIEYRNMLITDLDLNSDNNGDSLKLYLTSGGFYRGTLHLPRLAIHGGARGRQMTLTTHLSNPDQKLSAMMGLRVDSGGEDDRSVRFRFTPSYITLDDRTWYVGARSVIYDAPKVTVDGFRVWSEGNPSEELSVNGVLSRQQTDTLHIKLNRFDLAPLSRLTEGAGYRAEGRATGYIDFISILERTRMIAGIDFEGLSANGVEAAPLHFTSFWDREGERVRFQMLNQNNSVNVLRGSFAPSTGVLDAVATLDRLDVSLLDPVLKTAVEKTSGTANAQLNIGGTFRNLKLDGQIEVPKFETTVQFTQARYTLENGLIEVRDSRLTLPPTVVRDPSGNTADFSLGVDLSNMRNVGFELHAVPRNLLAFNTGPEDNEAFYGQVYATGALTIRGDKMGTRMDISATTGRDSRFFLPLNAKSNISWADFVVFSDSDRGIDTMNVLARKKLIYERQLNAGTKKKKGKPLDLDMTLNLTPDAEFQMLIDPSLGNGINAHGQGVINIRVNPANNLFSMVGDCTITSGKFEFSMMDLFNKDFAITPGSTLVWTGQPEDALLNVEGIYRVRTPLTPLIGDDRTTRSVAVDCILRLNGRLSQPDVTFDVRVPSLDTETQALVENAMNTQEMKSTQFLSLLMMGSFMPGNSLGQSGNVGSMTSGAVGFDLLSTQLSNLLSSEDYNVYFRYTPQNEYTGRGNEIDVGFSTGFIDNRLILEIEGNYVDDRAASSTGTGSVSNLAGDVSLTWVIDRAGNLKLKVFSQTIDRWNETQGQQENGLGIYYKKDFDTGRDLWHGIKDSFTNFGGNTRAEKRQRKKAEREERRQEKEDSKTNK